MQFQIKSIRGLMIAAMVFSSGAFAAEISMVSGLYSKTSKKIEGKNAGSTSTFGAGARYHDDLGGSTAWFASTNLFMNSYTAPDGRSSPDNAVNLSVGGGMRYYFKPFGAGLVPFAAGSLDVRNAKTVEWNDAGYAETTTNGLHYGASVGLRAGFDSNFFIELELPLFDSALFDVAKTVTVDESVAGTKTEKKEEVTTTQLWANSSSENPKAIVGIGYKF